MSKSLIQIVCVLKQDQVEIIELESQQIKETFKAVNSSRVSRQQIDYKFNSQWNINISPPGIVQAGSIESIHKDKSPWRDQ